MSKPTDARHLSIAAKLIAMQAGWKKPATQPAKGHCVAMKMKHLERWMRERIDRPGFVQVT